MPCLGKSVLFFERQFLSNEGNNYSSDAWLFWEGVNGGWFQINFPLHKMLWGRYFFLPLFIEEAELSREWAGQWLGFRAPSLDMCGWAGSAFFISGVLCPPSPLWMLQLPFCGSSPHPPLVPMPAAHATVLPPFKGPQLCASCGQDVQSTEVTRNLFLSPASPVTFL